MSFSIPKSKTVVHAKDTTVMEWYLQMNYPQFYQLLIKTSSAPSSTSSILSSSSLWRRLNKNKAFTIFCPSQIEEERLSQLLDVRNQEVCEKICSYHIIDEQITVQTMQQRIQQSRNNILSIGGSLSIEPTHESIQTVLPSWLGGEESKRVKVGGATILKSIPVGNGIIHEVDNFVSPDLLFRYNNQVQIPGTDIVEQFFQGILEQTIQIEEDRATRIMVGTSQTTIDLDTRALGILEQLETAPELLSSLGSPSLSQQRMLDTGSSQSSDGQAKNLKDNKLDLTTPKQNVTEVVNGSTTTFTDLPYFMKVPDTTTTINQTTTNQNQSTTVVDKKVTNEVQTISTKSIPSVNPKSKVTTIKTTAEEHTTASKVTSKSSSPSISLITESIPKALVQRQVMNISQRRNVITKREQDASILTAFLQSQYSSFFNILMKQNPDLYSNDKLWKCLDNCESFTIFAIPDHVFKIMDDVRRRQLIDGRNKELIDKIGLYHVVTEELMVQDLLETCDDNNGNVVLSTLGGPVSVESVSTRRKGGTQFFEGILGSGDKEEVVMVGGCQMSKSIHIASGIIHEIDGFIAPEILWRYADILRVPGSQ